MAINQIDTRDSFSSAATETSTGFSVGEIATAIVMPLASLKLTVTLLVLAVLMTFVATMEQAYDDVFNVKTRHFQSVMVEVPVQTFFPPAWFPRQQNLPGTLFLPSGGLILVLMIVNLTVAHSLRFKVQARGFRLVAGIVALLAAIAVTIAVIANGQSAGVQTQPLVSYATMWKLLPFLVLLVSMASISCAFLQDSKNRSQRGLLLYLGCLAGMTGLMLWAFNQSTYIGDSAMRIMWQLVQATVAAVAGYLACLVLFNRKAGMVLLHVGVMGLMVNEVMVNTLHKEQRLTASEGETVSSVIDIRYLEMAIIDTSDPEQDRIVNVPLSRLSTGQRVTSAELPFDVQCIKYMQNSQLVAPTADNLATTGVGLRTSAVEIPAIAGTDAEQSVDFSAAYVELFKKGTDDSLGIYLLAPQVRIDAADAVAVGDEDYHILMRYQTEYKPYVLTLNDANFEYYPGTKTPKHFESLVTIKRLDSAETTDQKIYMNNPLRYSGETFYQSGMPVPGPGQPQMTILQVVTNFGWMIPYVCCMFTVVGLVGQFGQSMTAHLNKQHQQRQSTEKHKRHWALWLPALLLFGPATVFCFSKLSVLTKSQPLAPVVSENGMRLDLLGQVPVTFEGRVQPLDSVARNALRQFRTRESATDETDTSRPAIQWLADQMFGTAAAGDYRTFYMTDPTVKNALELPTPNLLSPKRKQYVYTIDEVRKAAAKMADLIPDPDVLPENQWTALQRSTELLRRKLYLLAALESIFGTPDQADIFDQAGIMVAAARTQGIPYLVASKNSNSPWTSMASAGGPAWIKSIAGDAKTLEEVVQKKEFEDAMVQRIFLRMAATPEFRSLNVGDAARDPSQRQQMWRMLGDNTRTELLDRERQALKTRLLVINGGSQQVIDEVPENIRLLQTLKSAYRDGDAGTFNEAAESYLANLNDQPPTFYSQWKNNLELVFNSFSPFFVSTAMYVAALLFVGLAWAGFVWQGWRVSIGRMAIGMLLSAALIHAIGIAMRVGISGRPPVTNLYSSVIFVTWVGVLIALLLERFTKQGIGSMLAALTGFAGLLWAQSMANIDGDTFTVMVAVLDTTFWLATHVIMISLGYAATFMAGLIGLVFLLVNFGTKWFNEPRQRKLFANMLYGVVCFGLLASFFGTVLGGLWGDDSWGRFWGWDPKENGALMIVLWNALILHARWGGMVKERGVAALAVLGNVIVLWSWKGVNALGVGLHAYGFSEDKSLKWIILVGLLHLGIALLALLPRRFKLFPENAKAVS